MARDHCGEGFAFRAPIGGLAVKIENLAEAGAESVLDFAVEFDEGDAERGSKSGAERRFAGAAQADEGDALAPVARRLIAEGVAQEAPRLGQLGRA